MTQPMTRSTSTVGETLAEALGLRFPLSQALRALSEYPAVRRLSEMFDALQTWADQPEVRAVFTALHDMATVDERLRAYRRRWETERVPVSIHEAKYALLCLAYASFDEPVDAADYLADELGKAPIDETLAQYIRSARHSPDHWDALAQYRQTLLQANGDIPDALSDWPNRPRPPSRQGRPPRQWFRDRVLGSRGGCWVEQEGLWHFLFPIHPDIAVSIVSRDEANRLLPGPVQASNPRIVLMHNMPGRTGMSVRAVNKAMWARCESVAGIRRSDVEQAVLE